MYIYLISGIHTEVTVFVSEIDFVIDLAKPLPSLPLDKISRVYLGFDHISAEGIVAAVGAKVKVSVNVEVVIGRVGKALVLGGKVGSFLEIEADQDDSFPSDIEAVAKVGVTLNIGFKFESLVDNAIIFTTGAERENSTGMLMMYAAGEIIVRVSTMTQIWTLRFKARQLGEWYDCDITFDEIAGLAVNLGNLFIGRTTVADYHATIIKTDVKAKFILGRGITEDSSFNGAHMVVDTIKWFKAKREVCIGSGLLARGKYCGSDIK